LNIGLSIKYAFLFVLFLLVELSSFFPWTELLTFLRAMPALKLNKNCYAEHASSWRCR
jgi:hypothetical protein